MFGLKKLGVVAVGPKVRIIRRGGQMMLGNSYPGGNPVGVNDGNPSEVRVPSLKLTIADEK